MKKIFEVPDDLFRPLLFVKILERILFYNGEKFMFFLFFREPPKIL